MVLGGLNQTIRDKRVKIEKHLRPLPAVNLGVRWQCRCGLCYYVKYRGRFYCQQCGQRINNPDVATTKGETFRQAYEQARK